jgi:biotin carboxyl carrier protein
MKYYTKIGGREREFTFERKAGQLLAHSDGRTLRIDLSMVGDGTAFSLLVDGRSHDMILDAADGHILVQVAGEVVRVQVEDERERIAHEVAGARVGGKRTLKASMPGIVVEILVAEGEEVEDGQTLLILEAMKMQNPITAEGAGRIIKIHATAGAAIANGAPLIDLDS